MADTDFKTLIFEIEAAQSRQQRLELPKRLTDALEQGSPGDPDRRYLKSLLYHPDWYLRREAAFLIDQYQVALDPRERLQYAFALQDFELLQRSSSDDPEALAVLWSACQDPSPRIRSKVLSCLSEKDCQSPEHEAWLLYAASDYRALVELAALEEYRQAVIQCLEFGLRQEDNPDYHRKQCAFALEQLHIMDDAQAAIAQILQSAPATQEKNDKALHTSAGGGPAALTPLERLIDYLNRQGLLVDGQRTFPQIQIGSVTNRITYRHPALQTWSKQERESRIQPEPGYVLLRWDFRAMEPSLLLHFLLSRFFISLEDIPHGDIYLAIDPQDRQNAKNWLNAIINGGGRKYLISLNPFQMRLYDAIQELRQETLNHFHHTGVIETLGGRQLALEPNQSNLGGKALNRLIQGSASDVLHHAAVRLHQRLIGQMLPARIYFLLFDEIWIQADSNHSGVLIPVIEQTLLQVNQAFQLLYPLSLRFSASQPRP